MTRTLVSLPMIALVACAGAPASEAPPPGTTAASAPSTASTTAVPTATAEPTAAASVPPPAPPVELLDMPAKCQEACERNGAKCDTIDVPGCVKRCTETMAPAQPLCPKKMGAFWACVDADELRCKAGNKIRTVGCDDEAFGMMYCLINGQKTPEERCKRECKDMGLCTVEAGDCITASQADCDQSDYCKQKLEGQICVVVDKKCKIQNPPETE